LKFYGRFRRHMHAVEVASGGLLIALGVLLIFGRFALLAHYFSYFNRFVL
jgi:cytochrome c-type biogenesis protein